MFVVVVSCSCVNSFRLEQVMITSSKSVQEVIVCAARLMDYLYVEAVNCVRVDDRLLQCHHQALCYLGFELEDCGENGEHR